MSARRTARRITRVFGLAILALSGVFAVMVVVSAFRDPTARFMARRSHLVAVHEGPAEVIEAHWVRSVRLVAASGLEVDLLLKRPLASGPDGRASNAPRPTAVILGGHNTGRDAVRLIPDTRGVVVAALDYPYRGEHRVKGLAVLRYVPAIRQAILDTPPAAMLALDYLLRQPDVDPNQVEAVGVSLGAPFMVIASALDQRIARVWSVHGSAGSYAPLAHNMRQTIPFAPVRAIVAGLATMLISGPALAPEQWAPRIAPRPFVMINGRDDVQMPRALVERLYASAGEPKAIVWVPGGHVRARPGIVRPLVDTVLSRMLVAPTTLPVP